MDGWIRIGTEIEDDGYTAQIAKMEDDLDTLEQEFEVLSKAKPYENQKEDLLDYAAKIEKTKRQLDKLQQKQEELDRAGYDGLLESIDGVNSKLVGTISKVAKWGLALFGVRTAYNLIRNAVSTVSDYNDEVKNKIEMFQRKTDEINQRKQMQKMR